MTHVGYLVAGYGLTTAVLVAYVLVLRSRGRALSRYMSSPPSSAEPAVPGSAEADDSIR